LPPRSTVHGWFVRWHCDSVLDRLHFALYQKVRELEGHQASPTAAFVDSQSVKSAEKGRHIDPIGYDAAKKIKGTKRHPIVDALGLMHSLEVTSAYVQDRDGFLPLLKSVRRMFVFLERNATGVLL
jgi:transposase